MATLTDKEREALKRGCASAIVRPVETWVEILRSLPPHDAAARIFGDIHLYRAETNHGRRGYERRDGFLGDIQQLANALEAWAEIKARETAS